jgi:hypothetical protein
MNRRDPTPPAVAGAAMRPDVQVMPTGSGWPVPGPVRSRRLIYAVPVMVVAAADLLPAYLVFAALHRIHDRLPAAEIVLYRLTGISALTGIGILTLAAAAILTTGRTNHTRWLTDIAMLLAWVRLGAVTGFALPLAATGDNTYLGFIAVTDALTAVTVTVSTRRVLRPAPAHHHPPHPSAAGPAPQQDDTNPGRQPATGRPGIAAQPQLPAGEPWNGWRSLLPPPTGNSHGASPGTAARPATRRPIRPGSGLPLRRHLHRQVVVAAVVTPLLVAADVAVVARIGEPGPAAAIGLTTLLAACALLLAATTQARNAVTADNIDQPRMRSARTLGLTALIISVAGNAATLTTGLLQHTPGGNAPMSLLLVMLGLFPGNLGHAVHRLSRRLTRNPGQHHTGAPGRSQPPRRSAATPGRGHRADRDHDNPSRRAQPREGNHAE